MIFSDREQAEQVASRLLEEWGLPCKVKQEGDYFLLDARAGNTSRLEAIVDAYTEGATVLFDHAFTLLSLSRRADDLVRDGYFILAITPLVFSERGGSTWEILYCTREGKFARIG